MTNTNSTSNNNGSIHVSLLGLLGLALVVLKLCGVIAWSWWWVTLPFWAGFALILAVALVAFLALFFAAIGKRLRDW